jgi:hypothetical protein
MEIHHFDGNSPLSMAMHNFRWGLTVFDGHSQFPMAIHNFDGDPPFSMAIHHFDGNSPFSMGIRWELIAALETSAQTTVTLDPGRPKRW